MRRVDRHEYTLDQVREEISCLVEERLALRANGADPDALERNRVSLVEAQARLSDLLIRSNLGPAEA